MANGRCACSITDGTIDHEVGCSHDPDTGDGIAHTLAPNASGIWGHVPKCPKCEALLAPLRSAAQARDWRAFERAECVLFDHFAPGVHYLPKAEGMLPPDVKRELLALAGALIRGMSAYERLEVSGDAF